jgi:hypothetical protein
MKLFTELPLFKNKVVGGKFVIDEESVQDLKQRAPNWARQGLLTTYLFRQPRRKFPPMLVVVQERWVDDLQAKEWVDGRATRTSLPLTPLTTDGSVAILDLSTAVEVYILDGSHRYLGIKGLHELLNSGRLYGKKADGSQNKSVKEKDQLMLQYGLEDKDVSGLLDETIGVEFIPAVIAGETLEEASMRIRSIFVHVNKTAQPPTKGENAILDDDDGFALVAKNLAFNNALFKDLHDGDRINWKTNALPSGSKWLTSAVTLIQMVADYLQGVQMYENWKPDSPKEIPLRPDEDEIKKGITDAGELFTALATLPVFQSIASGTAIDALREFPNPTDPTKGGVGHLLLRPIGQQILAAAVGYMHTMPAGPKESLKGLFTRLADYDTAGGFENVHLPTSIWFGLTYNPQRKTMATDRKNEAVLLLRHMLHDQLKKSESDSLLDELRIARSTVSGGVDKVFDWDGKEIDPKSLKLPKQV